MTEKSSPASGSILLADDDDLFREGFAAQLAAAGYRCTQVASGPEALQQIGQQSFETVITDIHMPGNANLELVEALARLCPGLPIILLTGNPSLETATRSVRLPVFAYLCKPFDRVEMLSTVAQAVMAGRIHHTVRASRVRLQGLELELAEIEERLGKPMVPGTESPATSFVRVTLRNLATCLGDLERSIDESNPTSEPTAAVEKAELVTALRHTVEVLEGTRRSFKSRELGELRLRLRSLLPNSDDESESSPSA